MISKLSPSKIRRAEITLWADRSDVAWLVTMALTWVDARINTMEFQPTNGSYRFELSFSKPEDVVEFFQLAKKFDKLV